MAEQTSILKITGMSCGHCVHAVQQLIEEVSGVFRSEVDLDSMKATIAFDADSTDPETIIKHINSSNIYKAEQE